MEEFMNIYLIREYVNRLRKEDVNNYALKQNIVLDNSEIDFIYSYIKNNYRKILSRDISLSLDEVKPKLRDSTYNKLVILIYNNRDKINSFINKIRD